MGPDSGRTGPTPGTIPYRVLPAGNEAHLAASSTTGTPAVPGRGGNSYQETHVTPSSDSIPAAASTPDWLAGHIAGIAAGAAAPGIPARKDRPLVPDLSASNPRAVAEVVLGTIRDKALHDQALWIGWRTDTDEPAVGDLRGRPGECGTTACVAGWAALLTAPGNAVYQPRSERIRWPDGKTLTVLDAGRHALGLDGGDAAWLFSEHRTHGQVTAALESLADGKPMTRIEEP
jgi:hypothetical protein